jgi:hypothetical protein
MKNNILRKISPLSLVLFGVSAITTLGTAMIPSKSNDSTARFDGNGEAFASSNSGCLTVHFAEGGARSYTHTGFIPENNDGLSATSVDDAGTFTISHNGGPGDTYDATSSDQCPPQI